MRVLLQPWPPVVTAALRLLLPARPAGGTPRCRYATTAASAAKPYHTAWYGQRFRLRSCDGRRCCSASVHNHCPRRPADRSERFADTALSAGRSRRDSAKSASSATGRFRGGRRRCLAAPGVGQHGAMAPTNSTLTPEEELDSDEVRNDDGDEVVDPPEKWIEAKDDETSTSGSPTKTLTSTPDDIDPARRRRLGLRADRVMPDDELDRLDPQHARPRTRPDRRDAGGRRLVLRRRRVSDYSAWPAAPSLSGRPR